MVLKLPNNLEPALSIDDIVLPNIFVINLHNVDLPLPPFLEYNTIQTLFFFLLNTL